MLSSKGQTNAVRYGSNFHLNFHLQHVSVTITNKFAFPFRVLYNKKAVVDDAHRALNAKTKREKG